MSKAHCRFKLRYVHEVWRGCWRSQPPGSANYLGPAAVIASKDGRRLFVANADARQIAIVDAAGGKVLRAVPLPAEPTGMVLSPDGKRVYVTCARPAEHGLPDGGRSGRVIGSIPAGHTAMGPAVSPDGTRLYVCNRFNNSVSVIDLAGRREVARVPVGREPIAAAVTPDGKSVYVASHLPLDRADSSDVAATVTVIDAASLQDDDDPPAQRQFERAGPVRFARRKTRLRRAYSGSLPVAGHASGPRLDEHQRHERHRRPGQEARQHGALDNVDRGAANPWGVATTADGKTILVSHSGTHELSVIDAKGLFDKLARIAATPAAAETPNDLSFPRRLAAADRAPRQRSARPGRGRLEGLCGRVLQRHPGRGRLGVGRLEPRKPDRPGAQAATDG